VHSTSFRLWKPLKSRVVSPENGKLFNAQGKHKNKTKQKKILCTLYIGTSSTPFYNEQKETQQLPQQNWAANRSNRQL
jgi:hypothetical protein